MESLIPKNPTLAFEQVGPPDRATAVSRIWSAIQSLSNTASAVEEPAPVAEVTVADMIEAVPTRDQESSDIAQPDAVVPQSEEPADTANVAPHTPDVAPAEAPAKNKATRAKKAPKTAHGHRRAPRGSKTSQCDRDARNGRSNTLSLGPP